MERYTSSKMENKDFPILFDSKEKCCGCAACFAICPRSAISMKEDEQGFNYPEIDTDKCIKCFQCLKVCPLKG